MAFASSRSSINLRSCMSRAAHARVNEPAVALLVSAARQTAANAHRTPHWVRIMCMADLLDACVATALDLRLTFRMCVPILLVRRHPVNQPDVSWSRPRQGPGERETRCQKRTFAT